MRAFLLILCLFFPSVQGGRKDRQGRPSPQVSKPILLLTSALHLAESEEPPSRVQEEVSVVSEKSIGIFKVKIFESKSGVGASSTPFSQTGTRGSSGEPPSVDGMRTADGPLFPSYQSWNVEYCTSFPGAPSLVPVYHLPMYTACPGGWSPSMFPPGPVRPSFPGPTLERLPLAFLSLTERSMQRLVRGFPIESFGPLYLSSSLPVKASESSFIAIIDLEELRAAGAQVQVEQTWSVPPQWTYAVRAADFEEGGHSNSVGFPVHSVKMVKTYEEAQQLSAFLGPFAPRGPVPEVESTSCPPSSAGPSAEPAGSPPSQPLQEVSEEPKQETPKPPMKKDPLLYVREFENMSSFLLGRFKTGDGERCPSRLAFELAKEYMSSSGVQARVQDMEEVVRKVAEELRPQLEVIKHPMGSIIRCGFKPTWADLADSETESRDQVEVESAEGGERPQPCQESQHLEREEEQQNRYNRQRKKSRGEGERRKTKNRKTEKESERSEGEEEDESGIPKGMKWVKKVDSALHQQTSESVSVSSHQYSSTSGAAKRKKKREELKARREDKDIVERSEEGESWLWGEDVEESQNTESIDLPLTSSGYATLSLDEMMVLGKKGKLCSPNSDPVYLSSKSPLPASKGTKGTKQKVVLQLALEALVMDGATATAEVWDEGAGETQIYYALTSGEDSKNCVDLGQTAVLEAVVLHSGEDLDVKDLFVKARCKMLDLQGVRRTNNKWKAKPPRLEAWFPDKGPQIEKALEGKPVRKRGKLHMFSALEDIDPSKGSASRAMRLDLCQVKVLKSGLHSDLATSSVVLRKSDSGRGIAVKVEKPVLQGKTHYNHLFFPTGAILEVKDLREPSEELQEAEST